MITLEDFKKDVDLKKFCTFKIGGSAKLLYIAENTKSLIEVCHFCNRNAIKFKVIGLGANLLFSDNGFDGAIIVNRTNKVKFLKTNVVVDSGARVGSLITKCMLRSLSGIEKLAGIPSTVGGAVVNSLGAFETEFSDCVEYVECIDLDHPTKILRLKQADCGFGYRNSIFKGKNYLILKAKLNLNTKNIAEIESNIKSVLSKKSATQPLNYPSAGSIFKRQDGTIPAKLIDQLGLKGKTVGDAQISTKHAGFIVNLGNATSQNVKELINLIQTTVLKETGKQLEKEIEFVD